MDPQLTPAAWLQYLEPMLDEQITMIQQYQDYYDGTHALTMATAKFREAFSRYYAPLANNWMKIVVDAPVSRLKVQGFRFNVADPDVPTVNGTTPSWELDADSDAWQIWQANNLDSISRMLHTDAIKLGVSHVLVAPPDASKPTGKFPIITPEKATQCCVYRDPENRNHRLAGFKRWHDDISGYAYANVYLPDQIIKWRSAEPVKGIGQQKIQWIRRPDDPGMVNPMGVVSLIELENNPDLEYGGRSDLEDAISIQDAINKYCLDMQVSSEFHAYPQRWATGWERAVDDKGREISGREVELYLSASRFIRAEGKDTKFGAFEQGNVENYLQPIDMYITHLAAQTQTPLYYLKGKQSAISADAMHADEQGLVDRCEAKLLSLGDGWTEVMRCAFLSIRDQKRGAAQSAEVLWADVESQSLAVLVQAAMVMRTQLNVPIEMCWEMMGWSPQKIRLARDLMGLPPGGGLIMPGGAVAAQQAMAGPNANPGANDPNAHPGNQPGQPSGQAAVPVTASYPADRKELPG